MDKLKELLKKKRAWIAGFAGAGIVSIINGGAVEKVIIEQVMEAAHQGDLTKIGAYALIFFVIWLEVRGLKKEFAKLNGTIAKSFADGETRFTEIEHRLTLLENQHPIGGLNHGKTV